jgi:hypothetical protein
MPDSYAPSFVDLTLMTMEISHLQAVMPVVRCPGCTGL